MMISRFTLTRSVPSAPSGLPRATAARTIACRCVAYGRPFCHLTSAITVPRRRIPRNSCASRNNSGLTGSLLSAKRRSSAERHRPMPAMRRYAELPDEAGELWRGGAVPGHGGASRNENWDTRALTLFRNVHPVGDVAPAIPTGGGRCASHPHGRGTLRQASPREGDVAPGIPTGGGRCARHPHGRGTLRQASLREGDVAPATRWLLGREGCGWIVTEP
jgi:hypothetical protein